jgi:hypothetical protein
MLSVLIARQDGPHDAQEPLAALLQGPTSQSRR